MADRLDLPAPDRRLRAQRTQLAEYLAFRLDTGVFAIQVDRIGEILRIPPVTVVPRAPDFVMGIVGVRGRVLTVIDLRSRLKLACPDPTRHARILVVPAGSPDPVGLYVDEVLHVHRFDEADIEPAARALGTDSGEHVAGIARIDDLLVVVLRLDQLLALGVLSS
jgi:purine-binding chemotaxis protein CheW